MRNPFAILFLQLCIWKGVEDFGNPERVSAPARREHTMIQPETYVYQSGSLPQAALMPDNNALTSSRCPWPAFMTI